MTTIHITTHSRLSPDRVLEAGHDFSARRAEIFPAVSIPYFEVHDLSQCSADVTEGTPSGVGVNWERCRYDWSSPGSVKAVVTDSNVYAPASSSWELRAAPADSGSKVEMIWVRQFTHNARGRIFGTLFRVIGKPIFTREAKRTIRNLERLETTGLRPVREFRVPGCPQLLGAAATAHRRGLTPRPIRQAALHRAVCRAARTPVSLVNRLPLPTTRVSRAQPMGDALRAGSWRGRQRER
jgi:hypothetical protein